MRTHTSYSYNPPELLRRSLLPIHSLLYPFTHSFNSYYSLTLPPVTQYVREAHSVRSTQSLTLVVCVCVYVYVCMCMCVLFVLFVSVRLCSSYAYASRLCCAVRLVCRVHLLYLVRLVRLCLSRLSCSSCLYYPLSSLPIRVIRTVRVV